MAFVLADSISGFDEIGTDPLVLGDLSVTAGDLIVVGCGCGTQNPYCSAIADDDGNEYTLGAIVFSDSNIVSVRVGYAIAKSTQAALTITCSVSASSQKDAWAVAFTPTAGKTPSYDTCGIKAGASFEASPWETLTFTTTGDDEVCIAFFKGNGATPFSNEEIPNGTAATGVLGTAAGNLHCFYRIGTVSNDIAEMATSGSQYYAAACYCFKAEAGGSIVPLVMSYYRRLRS